MSESHRPFEDELASYVLGALEPSEAQAFERHLEWCAECRNELAELSPVVDTLALAAPRLKVPRRLRRRVMRFVRAEAKVPAVRTAPLRLRRVALAGATALALALVGYATIGSHRPGTRVIHAAAGRAELRVTGGDRGELIVDHLPPAPPGRIYEMWLDRGGRTPAPSTLFAVTNRGTADVGVPGGVSGVRGVLVTLEPTGGTLQPTTSPVIRVPVA